MHRDFERAVYEAILNEIFLARNQGEKYLFIWTDWAKHSLDLGTWMTERTVAKLAREGYLVLKVSDDLYLIDFVEEDKLYDKL